MWSLSGPCSNNAKSLLLFVRKYYHTAQTFYDPTNADSTCSAGGKQPMATDADVG